MKRFLTAFFGALLAFFLLSATPAKAQCIGVFGASTVCGSVSGGPPGPVPFSALGSGSVGIAGAVQMANGSGGFSDSTMLMAAASGATGVYLQLPILGTTGGGSIIFGNFNSYAQAAHEFISCQGCNVTNAAGGTTAFVGTDGSNTPIVGGAGGLGTSAHMTAIGPSVDCEGGEAICIGHQAAGLSSNDVALGRSATANTNGGNVAVGNGPTAEGGDTVAIGTLASNLATQSVAIGKTATVPSGAILAVAIGSGAQVGSAGEGVAIGASTNAAAFGDIAVGEGTTTSGSTANLAIGLGATATGGGGIAIGSSASMVATEGIAIGKSASIPGSDFWSIAIGSGAAVTSSGHAVIGGSHITQVYAGTESGGASTHSDAHYMTGVAFASLPSAAAGEMSYITDGKASNCGDSACTTWGTTVTAGGGALKLLIWNNGTNWTLVGK